MQAITKYLADDGTEHATADACRGWENAKRSATEAMSPLGTRLEFCNGDFIQHDIAAVNAARSKLLRCMRTYHPSWPWYKWGDDDSKYHPMGILGRYIDDGGSPFGKAWRRLMCISFATGREYDQPYFAIHEDEATGENV